MYNVFLQRRLSNRTNPRCSNVGKQRYHNDAITLHQLRFVSWVVIGAFFAAARVLEKVILGGWDSADTPRTVVQSVKDESSGRVAINIREALVAQGTNHLDAVQQKIKNKSSKCDLQLVLFSVFIMMTYYYYSVK